MSKRRASLALRREVAAGLREALQKNKLTVAEAAEQLDVKRQTLYLYLRGEIMPGGRVLARACDLWDLSFNVGGLVVNKGSFGRLREKPGPVAKQLEFELARTLGEIRPDQIETKLIPVGKNLVEVRVRIKVAS